MLSATTFEQINGHVAHFFPCQPGHSVRAWCECNCNKVRASVLVYGDFARTEAQALESLRDAVLNEHRQIVLARDGWKCRNCDGLAGLSVHHKIFRSHGRDDRCENLESRCSTCHAQSHREPSFRPAETKPA